MTQATAPLPIGDGVLRAADGGETLWRVVRDVERKYALPHLQSARDLPVRGAPAGALTLAAADGTAHRPEADGPDAVVFRGLPAGEYTLPVDAADGPPEAIGESARYCLENASPGGGYIFGTSNTIFDGMPLAHYEIMLDVYRDWCGRS